VYNNVPITVAVRMYRNLLYDLRMPRLIDFLVLGSSALVVLLAGWWLFDRFEGRFAEEL
jgi:ABC-type polysaccharide/polyol phosphate export permease